MRSSDFTFRIGVGAFAAALLLIVVAIAVSLANDSALSIQKFGMRFWGTSNWDPVAGEFGQTACVSPDGQRFLGVHR